MKIDLSSIISVVFLVILVQCMMAFAQQTTAPPLSQPQPQQNTSLAANQTNSTQTPLKSNTTAAPTSTITTTKTNSAHTTFSSLIVLIFLILSTLIFIF